MSWLEKVKEHAPTVAAALATGGTALPVAAVQILSKELFGVSTADEPDITIELERLGTKAAKGDPEAIAKLKKVEHTHTQQMAALYYKDRADARKRDIAIQSKRGSNSRADRMLFGAFLGFVLCLAALMWSFYEYLDQGKQPDAGLIGVLCTFGTTFLAMLKEAFGFEFGGSADGEKANRNIQALLTRQVTRKE